MIGICPDSWTVQLAAALYFTNRSYTREGSVKGWREGEGEGLWSNQLQNTEDKG